VGESVPHKAFRSISCYGIAKMLQIYPDTFLQAVSPGQPAGNALHLQTTRIAA